MFRISTRCLFILLACTIRFENCSGFIIFPEGIGWVQWLIGIGIPVDLMTTFQACTLGLVFKSTYPIPMNSTIFTDPMIQTLRKKRSTSFRWGFYATLAASAESMGIGGKACVLRAICEMAESPFDPRAGILAELLHIIFTPSATSEALSDHSDNEYHAAEQLGRKMHDCQALFPDCEFSILDIFSSTV